MIFVGLYFPSNLSNGQSIKYIILFNDIKAVVFGLKERIIINEHCSNSVNSNKFTKFNIQFKQNIDNYCHLLHTYIETEASERIDMKSTFLYFSH